MLKFVFLLEIKHEIRISNVLWSGLLWDADNTLWEAKEKKWSIWKYMHELELYWWLAPKKWFYNAKRQLIAQPFKEIPRKSQEQCCQYAVHIFPSLSPFCFSLFLPFLSLLLLLFHPIFLFLSSLSFSLVYDQIWKYWLLELEFDLEFGKVFLNK